MDFLQSFDRSDAVIKKVVDGARKKNLEFRDEFLSSRELNDISMQMFRVQAISEMIPCATKVFVDNVDRMMIGTIEPGFELIKRSPCGPLCKATKDFDLRHGFQHREVLALELKGNNYIKAMMTMLSSAISVGDNPKAPFERYVFGEISENYRRVFRTTDEQKYAKFQLLCDAISGMTESHLVHKHDEFRALKVERP
jgi:dGTPase